MAFAILNNIQTHMCNNDQSKESKVKQASRYKVENSQPLTKPNIQEPTEAVLKDNFQTIAILCSALGHPIFEYTHQNERENLFFCNGNKFVT